MLMKNGNGGHLGGAPTNGGGGGVSPVSGCCGLKLKKSPSPGGVLEAWQHGKVNGPRKPREVQRGPKRVTRRGVGPAEKGEKSAGD